jgi:DNA-binding HxlR family transcriptional regulator
MNDTRKPVDYAGEGWCPLTAASSVLCRKWHPVIIHRLFEHGSIGFNELKREIDGISGKVLSDSLDHLEEVDIVIREQVSEKPLRVDYSLTEFGQSLEPVIEAMQDWGKDHLQPEQNN